MNREQFQAIIDSPGRCVDLSDKLLKAHAGFMAMQILQHKDTGFSIVDYTTTWLRSLGDCPLMDSARGYANRIMNMALAKTGSMPGSNHEMSYFIEIARATRRRKDIESFREAIAQCLEKDRGYSTIKSTVKAMWFINLAALTKSSVDEQKAEEMIGKLNLHYSHEDTRARIQWATLLGDIKKLLELRDYIFDEKAYYKDRSQETPRDPIVSYLVKTFAAIGKHELAKETIIQWVGNFSDEARQKELRDARKKATETWQHILKDCAKWQMEIAYELAKDYRLPMYAELFGLVCHPADDSRKLLEVYTICGILDKAEPIALKFVPDRTQWQCGETGKLRITLEKADLQKHSAAELIASLNKSKDVVPTYIKQLIFDKLVEEGKLDEARKHINTGTTNQWKILKKWLTILKPLQEKEKAS